MQPVILGEFCGQSSAAPSACSTVEPLQHGSISPQGVWRSVEGFSTGGLESKLCASTGLLAFRLPSIKIPLKVTSWSLEIEKFLPFLETRRSFFAKYLITPAGPSACCREVPNCAGKAVSWERVNHRRKLGLSSSLLFPSFLCSLPLSFKSWPQSEGGGGWARSLAPAAAELFPALGVRAPGAARGRRQRSRPGTERSPRRSPGDETARLSRGLTSFLSLCLLKLLPVASGFPEGSSWAEAGEGSGRGVEESSYSHPGPRLGLHGKVSAVGCPTIPVLACLGCPDTLLCSLVP